MSIQWKNVKKYNSEYLFGETSNFKLKSNISSFDIDSTIIHTKSGSKFPKDKDDWIFFNEDTCKSLQELNKTRSIIFITNQNGLNTTNKINEWKIKIENILSQLNIELRIYCALYKDIFRKPFPTFMNMIKDETNNKKLDIYYCGDAAGRTKDFTDTDYKFALNSSTIFYVPEQIFGGSQKGDINFNYVSLKPNKINEPFKPIQNGNEIILMVGYPGSGKSKYVIDNILPQKYKIINQDTLKTKAKCIKETKKYILNKENIVIDNLNYSMETRKEYIDIAKQNQYRVRCIILMTSKELSIHNMLHRMYITEGQVSRISDIVYNKMKKQYVKPLYSEKIDIIDEVEFMMPTNDSYKLYFS